MDTIFRHPTFAEYSVVRLISPASAFGVQYPIGTEGIIVHRYGDGAGYEVEFDTPDWGVATVTYRDIETSN